MDLRAIHGDHPRVDQTSLRTQPENLAEEAGQRVPMTLAKPRDRRVIGNLVSGEHAEGDVFLTRPLDRAGRHPFAQQPPWKAEAEARVTSGCAPDARAASRGDARRDSPRR